MASAQATLELDVPTDEVWQLIGGFGSIPDWIPGMEQIKFADGGRVRHLRDVAGDTFVERLETYDLAKRLYSYSIVASPVAVTGYLATLSVAPSKDGSGSQVNWTAVFTPVSMSQAEAEATFNNLFAGGLRALSEWFVSGQVAKEPDVSHVDQRS